MPDPSGQFGFPPGVARAKIMESFKSFEDKSFSLYPAERKMVEDAIAAAKAKKSGKAVVAPVVAPVESMPTMMLETKSTAPPSLPVTAPAPTVTPKDANDAISSTNNNATAYSTPTVEPEVTSSSSSNSPPPATPSAPPLAVREEEVPPSEFQSNADSYNGAVRDRYSWGQTIKDLDLRVKVDKSVKKVVGNFRVDRHLHLALMTGLQICQMMSDSVIDGPFIFCRENKSV